MSTAGQGGCCSRDAGCGCDPLVPPRAEVANPPAQPALRWRASPHSHALARLRSGLADQAQPAHVRALAFAGADDPAIALLDAFAVVADTVSFYTERLAQELFVRTATELESVRQLGRTIGYELRPGVSAEAAVAFTVETAPGAPAVVDVPRGTPVQSVPGPGELPQTFETGADLTAHAVWNAVPAAPARRQHPQYGDRTIWLRGTGLGLVPGNALLLVGAERERSAAAGGAGDEQWDFRYVDHVEQPPAAPGWTLVHLDKAIGYRPGRPLVATEDVRVFHLRRRTSLFGWSAPDPALIDPNPLPVGEDLDWAGIGDPRVPQGDDVVEDVVELDGDLTTLVSGSWIVLERDDYRELYRVEDADPGGATRFAVSGKTTRVRVDLVENLSRFGRRESLVHYESTELHAADAPTIAPVTGSTLLLAATDPELPVGRVLMVTGWAPGTVPADPLVRAATPPPLAEQVTVVAVTATEDPRTVQVDVAPALTHAYDPLAVRVLANVAIATHGETVHQVLGSGDGSTPFQRLTTLRGPLTHLAADTASGGRSTLEVYVDDVAWEPVVSLDTVAGTQRAYVARLDGDLHATVTTGDGTHGARLPTGSENVRATYRVGIGEDGALDAGQLSLLPRRPRGIVSAVNPSASHGWAPPEDLESARTVAPQRIRTLDRAVSVADYEDFAAGYSGVGLARADAVWNGHERVVVVTVLGPAGAAPGTDLVTRLTASLEAARDAGSHFLVLPGKVVGFGVRVAVQSDPSLPRADVEAAVAADLGARYAAGTRALAQPVTASRLLVETRAVPGVLACGMPALHVPSVAAGGTPRSVLAALPARFDAATGDVLGAQVLALTGGVDVGEMT